MRATNALSERCSKRILRRTSELGCAAITETALSGVCGLYAHLVEETHRDAVEKLASFLVPSGPKEEEALLRIQ